MTLLMIGSREVGLSSQFGLCAPCFLGMGTTNEYFQSWGIHTQLIDRLNSSVTEAIAAAVAFNIRHPDHWPWWCQGNICIEEFNCLQNCLEFEGLSLWK